MIKFIAVWLIMPNITRRRTRPKETLLRPMCVKAPWEPLPTSEQQLDGTTNQISARTTKKLAFAVSEVIFIIIIHQSFAKSFNRQTFDVPFIQIAVNFCTIVPTTSLVGNWREKKEGKVNRQKRTTNMKFILTKRIYLSSVLFAAIPSSIP